MLALYDKSRPAWDAWIEMLSDPLERDIVYGRVPHGTRGLKYRGKHQTFRPMSSRPAWDAWIEIATPYQLKHIIRRRVPHGTRGLKFH